MHIKTGLTWLGGGGGDRKAEDESEVSISHKGIELRAKKNQIEYNN